MASTDPTPAPSPHARTHAHAHGVQPPHAPHSPHQELYRRETVRIPVGATPRQEANLRAEAAIAEAEAEAEGEGEGEAGAGADERPGWFVYPLTPEQVRDERNHYIRAVLRNSQRMVSSFAAAVVYAEAQQAAHPRPAHKRIPISLVNTTENLPEASLRTLREHVRWVGAGAQGRRGAGAWSLLLLLLVLLLLLLLLLLVLLLVGVVVVVVACWCCCWTPAYVPVLYMPVCAAAAPPPRAAMIQY